MDSVMSNNLPHLTEEEYKAFSEDPTFGLKFREKRSKMREGFRDVYHDEANSLHMDAIQP